MTEDKKTTALARREFSLLPNSLGEAQEFARLIAGSEFAPKGYQDKPANIIIAVQMGADVGLKPMQALQSIAVINGRPSLWGDGALAVALPALDYCVEKIDGEGDARVATCRLRRKGWPEDTVRTFSVADAKQANLWGKQGPWTSYPQRMLQMRARSWALRDTCSDLLMGLQIAEEVMDYPDAIDTQAVHVEEAKPEPMERIPEGMRDNVEKAFTALNFSPAQRLAKINEFMGVAERTPDDSATLLLEWCRDEYARRKTGKPVARSNNKVQPKPEAPKAEEPKQTVSNSEPTATAPAPPAVKDGEVVEPPVEATPQVSSSDIPWGNQGVKVEGEMF